MDLWQETLRKILVWIYRCFVQGHIVASENIQCALLTADNGALVVNDRLDPEELWGDVTLCSFTFDILLENPMEMHPITVKIMDINDNSLAFQNSQLEFQFHFISQLAFCFGERHLRSPNKTVNFIMIEYYIFRVYTHVCLSTIAYCFANPLSNMQQHFSYD